MWNWFKNLFKKKTDQELIAEKMTDIELKPHPFITETRRGIKRQYKLKKLKTGYKLSLGRKLPSLQSHYFIDGYTLEAHR